MRVTTGMSMRNTLRSLSDSLDRLHDSQRRLASGRAHERMSDDPQSATDVMFLRGQIQRHEQMARTSEDTRSRLTVADTTLIGVSDILIRAKELTVRASNSGANGVDGQAALAAEMRLLRQEVLSQANTSYLGRGLFSGTAAGPAYDETSGALLGNDTIEERTVAEQMRVPANVTAKQAFGDPADSTGDLFAIMDRLADAIEANDVTAIASEHINLDGASARLGSAMAEVGRRVSQLDAVEERGGLRRVQLNARLSNVEDVDTAEAVLDMKARHTAYEAALSAAAKAMPNSLAQYLR